MNLLIFRSEVTRAVYCWNGKETVTIKNSPGRPLGKVMKGMDNNKLELIFVNNIIKTKPHKPQKEFLIGSAKFTVIAAI